MRNLRWCPAELENHNKGNIVHEQGPSWCVFTTNAEVENEWKGTSNAHNSNEMPDFSATVFTISGFIGFHTNKRRWKSISDLTDQQQSSRSQIWKLSNLMKVKQKICKPHWSAKVIKNMTDSVANSSSPGHFHLSFDTLGHARVFFQLMRNDYTMKITCTCDPLEIDFPSRKLCRRLRITYLSADSIKTHNLDLRS